MAITKCNDIVKGNVAVDCTSPWRAGILDVAIAWHFSDIELTFSPTNKNMVTGYTPKSGAKPFAIYSRKKIPFADTATAINSETLINTYNKTLPFSVPVGSAKASLEVIDPIVQSTEGFIVFFKTKNKVADGSVVVFGAHTGLLSNGEGGRNYTDPNLGAACALTLVETGAESETVTFVGDDATPTYATVMAAWDEMLALVTY